MSRSASKPDSDSASLRSARAAKLPDLTKPTTGGEAMGVSSHRALRGGWGRRAGIDRLRNLGDPPGGALRGQRPRGIHNPGAAGCGSRTLRHRFHSYSTGSCAVGPQADAPWAVHEPPLRKEPQTPKAGLRNPIAWMAQGQKKFHMFDRDSRTGAPPSRVSCGA